MVYFYSTYFIFEYDVYGNRVMELHQSWNDDHWEDDDLRIQEEEIGTSFDFRFVKARPLVRHNNVVVNVRNQFGDAMPFYSIPIGGVPTYKGEVELTPLPDEE